jgi:hypothetical protein
VRTIRLVASGSDDHARAVATHIKAMQAHGPVLFVTADRPYSSWDPTLTAAAVDRSRLCVIDVVSGMGGVLPAVRPDNVVFLPSPTLLEMVVLRIEQGCQRSKATHVVVDSLNTFALYNGLAPVQAFAHYLINRARDAGVGLDLVVRDNQEGEALNARLAGFVDDSVRLVAA